MSGIGAYKFFVLTLRHTIRHGGPPAHMFVSDNKGRMLHVSMGFASMLGSTPKELLSAGCQGAVEALMLQPFTQLHHKIQHVSHRESFKIPKRENRNSSVEAPACESQSVVQNSNKVQLKLKFRC